MSASEVEEEGNDFVPESDQLDPTDDIAKQAAAPALSHSTEWVNVDKMNLGDEVAPASPALAAASILEETAVLPVETPVSCVLLVSPWRR
jgi:hypothetical protein